ncbi:unnamed protein product [Protopolystoma xenopodis]|uniref:Uncharacterized protein n=1 Tax=Protopolystoma xenopodis TaxID=117903 RepID=A0A3S5AID4_9PLAT|nr:unnamed protein product [Protopolystoma xenopodis]
MISISGLLIFLLLRQTGQRRCGFFGHLRLISNHIVDLLNVVDIETAKYGRLTLSDTPVEEASVLSKPTDSALSASMVPNIFDNPCPPEIDTNGSNISAAISSSENNVCSVPDANDDCEPSSSASPCEDHSIKDTEPNQIFPPRPILKRPSSIDLCLRSGETQSPQ